MGRIDGHLADFVVFVEQERDLVRLLQHRHSHVLEDERHRFGPTLVRRVRIGNAFERNLAV
jgi:hypothetical protein